METSWLATLAYTQSREIERQTGVFPEGGQRGRMRRASGEGG